MMFSTIISWTVNVMEKSKLHYRKQIEFSIILVFFNFHESCVILELFKLKVQNDLSMHLVFRKYLENGYSY